MPLIDRLKRLHAEMTAWRRDIHAHPETAFEETRTAQVVAEKLASFGIEVHRGLAKTGVVGALRAGSGTRAIGLRADLDALHIHEQNTFAHRSHERRADARVRARRPHDDAARRGEVPRRDAAASTARSTSSSSRPRRTRAAGARWSRKACSSASRARRVYGMHNWPGMPVGKFGVLPGPDDGVVRHLRDRDHRARRARRDAARRASTRSSRRARSCRRCRRSRAAT